MGLPNFPHIGVVVKYILLSMMVSSRSSVMSTLQLPTGNYTRRDVHFGKYFKAINQFGKQVLHVVFIAIYSVLETSNGSLSVENYCNQKLNWTNAKYRSVFTATERDILKNDPHGPNFLCDITLLFKLIANVLGNMAEPFMQELRDLKNLRNTVCHEDIAMNEADLSSRIDALENLCCKILQGLGSVTAEDVESYVKELKDGLRDLLHAKIEISDIQSYLEDVDNFRQQKHSKFIIEGRRELADAYSKVKTLNPCTWLSDNKFSEFSVDRIFTTLVVLSDGVQIQMNDIMNVNVLKTRFVPRLIIVSGVMGAGKTSLYRYILDEWCRYSKKITGLSSVDIVIGIELRAVSCGSLVQYLREQLLQSTSRLFSATDIIPLLQEMNVLFAIDGMDEANMHGRMIVREIVNKFVNSRIIITTRPAFMLELMKMAEDHVILHVEGFNDQGKLQFVNKVFAAKYDNEDYRDQETQRFLNYLSTTCKTISSHLTIPLTLALLLVLWCDETVDVSSITTLTRLYHKIYEMCQQKLVSRLEVAGAGHSVSLSRKVYRWLIELGHVAWKMMQRDLLEIREEDSKHLMNICEKEGIDPIQTMSAFLNCEVKETLIATNYKFSFHHASGLDFLAAMYVSKQISENHSGSDIFSDIDSPRYREILMYVTGLLKINGNLNTTLASFIKTSLVCEVKVPPSDYGTWWRLLQEAETDSSMSTVLGSIINQSPVWIVTTCNSDEKTEAKLNLLRETGASPAELIMSVPYNRSLSGCPKLQDILSLVGKAQKTRVKLYLEKDFNSVEHKELSDKYVVDLLKSNCLVEFIGHVGEDFMSALTWATKVESLFIRVSTVKALQQLGESFKKHKRWKERIMPIRKWSLKSVELFIDLHEDVVPDDIPNLQYKQRLDVKLADVTDKNAMWAGMILKNLNSSYSSVILQSSRLTGSGMNDLLEAASHTKIKAIRVLSKYAPTPQEISKIGNKYNVRLGWGSA